MGSNSPAGVVDVRDRFAPIGRPLAVACLLAGYSAVVLSIVAPNTLDAVLGIVPDETVLPIGSLVTFAFPAAYIILELVAAAGVVAEQSGGSRWNRRERIHVFLAVAFGDWTTHHLLYLLFPLTLLWGYLSFLVGIVYAVPVWAMVCVSAVGVLVGNRYSWYHDPDDLPEGAEVGG